MSRRLLVRTTLACAVTAGLGAVAAGAGIQTAALDTALTLGATRISIDGTSNIHAYTASTTEVRLTRLQLKHGVAGAHALNGILAPGAVEALEIAVPAATLSSPRDGLDKNMHRALNVTQFPEISFRLLRLEPAEAPGAFRATGVLSVAGEEQEVVLDVSAAIEGARLMIAGEVDLLMTDFGIAPPRAMLGMLRTNPAVTVRFETALELPQT